MNVQLKIIREVCAKSRNETSAKTAVNNATLDSVAQYGLQKTTIITISRIAGLSSGIISHYFGDKQGLIEATVKYLLQQLKLALLERVSQPSLSAADRLKNDCRS